MHLMYASGSGTASNIVYWNGRYVIVITGLLQFKYAKFILLLALVMLFLALLD